MATRGGAGGKLKSVNLACHCGNSKWSFKRSLCCGHTLSLRGEHENKHNGYPPCLVISFTDTTPHGALVLLHGEPAAGQSASELNVVYHRTRYYDGVETLEAVSRALEVLPGPAIQDVFCVGRQFAPSLPAYMQFCEKQLLIKIQTQGVRPS